MNIILLHRAVVSFSITKKEKEVRSEFTNSMQSPLCTSITIIINSIISNFNTNGTKSL